MRNSDRSGGKATMSPHGEFTETDMCSCRILYPSAMAEYSRHHWPAREQGALLVLLTAYNSITKTQIP